MKALAEHTLSNLWWPVASRRIGDEYHGSFSSCEVYQLAAIKTGTKRSEQLSYPWLSYKRGVRRHADPECNLVLAKSVVRQDRGRKCKASSGVRAMMYRLVVWSLIVWTAICCAPYVYAGNPNGEPAMSLAPHQHRSAVDPCQGTPTTPRYWYLSDPIPMDMLTVPTFRGGCHFNTSGQRKRPGQWSAHASENEV